MGGWIGHNAPISAAIARTKGGVPACTGYENQSIGYLPPHRNPSNKFFCKVQSRWSMSDGVTRPGTMPESRRLPVLHSANRTQVSEHSALASSWQLAWRASSRDSFTSISTFGRRCQLLWSCHERQRFHTPWRLWASAQWVEYHHRCNCIAQSAALRKQAS